MIVGIILNRLALSYPRNRENVVDASESVDSLLECPDLAIPVRGVELDGEGLVAVRFELLNYLLRA